MHSNNFIDLTGKVFGNYTVLHLAEPQISPKGKRKTMWTCRCICGVVKDVWAEHLKNRPNISCGCKKRTTLEDLTNFEINYVHVNNRAPSLPKANGKFRTMWNCTCLNCGKEFIAAASDIKSGRRYSCGCKLLELRSKNMIEDLTNQKFGRLTVRKRAENYVKPSGSKDTMWVCLCDCGKECIKRATYLKKSPTPSCGCWSSEITSKRVSKDITGQTFGELYVVEKIGTKKTAGNNIKSIYLCYCFNCGSFKNITYNSLINENTRSCGCIKSFGEKEIREELNNQKIKYTTQYYFKDLYTDKNHPLFFDFAIFNENNELLFLIEYQGKQHYYEQPSNPEFGKQQREITDKMKKDYCQAHNINLFEIKYNENIKERLDNILTTYVNFVPSKQFIV